MCIRDRTYSDHEKIVETLRYIHSHIDDPEMDYYRKTAIYSAIKKDPDAASFAKAYIADKPDCCEVYRPAAYEEWRQQRIPIPGEQGEWVADVAVEHKLIAPNSKYRMLADFAVNNCNKVIFLHRG